MRSLLLAALLLLASPAAALAAPPTVIDFEGIPPNQQIADQYAGQGVAFGRPAAFGLPEPARTCGTGGFAFAGGTSGTSNSFACRTGSVEFPTRFFSTAFEFATERRDVRFDLQQRVANQVDGTLRVYGIGGVLLEERPLSLARNVTQRIVVTRGTAQIAAIVIFGDLGPNDSGPVMMDDLVALLDDTPPPPKWALAMTTPSIEVVEGATSPATVSVRRFNGSTGPVTLSVPELPPGITATQLDPNPVTGKDPVALRVTAARLLTGERQITVDASGGGSAGTGVVTQGVQTVRILPAVQLAEGGRFVRTLAAGCGPQRFRESYTVRGGLATSVSLAPLGTGGLVATANPSSQFVTGDGLYSYDLDVDPATAAGVQPVRLRVRPTGATAAELDVNFRVQPVTIAAIAPQVVPRPRLGRTGRVTVRGTFPLDCAVRFLDPTGAEWRVIERDSTEVDGRRFELWTLEVPADSTSGPLRVVSPTGAELTRTSPFELTDLRNTHALSQPNSGAGARTNAYTWADFERTFGTDDTDACFIFCVRDPIASDYYDRWSAQVTANPGGGLCSGWSQMALRFRLGAQSPGQYTPGARRAFDIAPLSDGTAVKRDVVRWQVAQFHKGFQEERTRAFARSAADERTLLKQAVNVGGAYVGIRQGNSGHAVVAYSVADIATPTGPGLSVAIYDPNQPYAAGEETSTAARTAALTSSTITIQGDGSWAGSSLGWSGPNGTLMATTLLPPEDATLPSSFSLASLFGSSGDAPPAEVTQITAGGAPALGPGGEPRPGSGVVLQPNLSGAGPLPEYRLEPGREYAMTVRGTSGGRYEHGTIGDGASASVSAVAIAAGAEDTVTLRPGQALLGFRSAGGGPVTYELADEIGRATRTAKVVTSTGRGGGDETELSGGALRLRHDGPAAPVSVTLASVGEGLPSSVTTAPVRIGAGQRLELRPASWRDLQAGVGLTVRDRRGRVVRQGRARLRVTRAVALSGVRARRSGRRVTLTGRITRPGGAPVLAAVVERLRGGRVISRKAVTRRGAQVVRGRFSLPVDVGAARPGVRLRASVALLDEAADLASVRRTVLLRR